MGIHVDALACSLQYRRILNLNYLISVWLSPTWDVGSAVTTKSARSVQAPHALVAASQEATHSLTHSIHSFHLTLQLRQMKSHSHFNNFQRCSGVGVGVAALPLCHFVAVDCLCSRHVAFVVLIWIVCCVSSALPCSEYSLPSCALCQGAGCGSWSLDEMHSSKRMASANEDVADAVKLQISCSVEFFYFIWLLAKFSAYFA